MTQTALNFDTDTVTDEMFKQIRDALCPWSTGFAATRARLGDRELDRIWEVADGYGWMTLAKLRALELARDWSHIRDASDAALFRIWGRLARRGIVR